MIRWFPKVDYRWFIEEAESNISQELDFELEAQNCERCRNMFSSRHDVIVPRGKNPLQVSHFQIVFIDTFQKTYFKKSGGLFKRRCLTQASCLRWPKATSRAAKPPSAATNFSKAPSVGKLFQKSALRAAKTVCAKKIHSKKVT